MSVKLHGERRGRGEKGDSHTRTPNTTYTYKSSFQKKNNRKLLLAAAVGKDNTSAIIQAILMRFDYLIWRCVKSLNKEVINSIV